MNFNKWAILWSIVNGIISIVGLTAIFFPDAFILEKKIKKLEMEVKTNKDFSKFYSFLKERVKDKKPFVVDISFCSKKYKLKEDVMYTFLIKDEYEYQYEFYVPYSIYKTRYIDDFGDEELKKYSSLDEVFKLDLDKNHEIYGICTYCGEEAYGFPEGIFRQFSETDFNRCNNSDGYALEGSMIYSYDLYSEYGHTMSFRKANPIDFQVQE